MAQVRIETNQGHREGEANLQVWERYGKRRVYVNVDRFQANYYDRDRGWLFPPSDGGSTDIIANALGLTRATIEAIGRGEQSWPPRSEAIAEPLERGEYAQVEDSSIRRSIAVEQVGAPAGVLCRICGSPHHAADGDQVYDYDEDGYMPAVCKAYLRSK